MVEVPSHVMELFLEDPRVLQLMSRYSQHAQGGSASMVPLEEAASWQRRERKFEALSLQHQVCIVVYSPDILPNLNQPGLLLQCEAVLNNIFSSAV